MPPKSHRSGSTGRLGARSNSASKIATNLQFTHKDLPQSKHTDKHKKATGYSNDKTPLARVNSSHRVQSRDQIQPLKRGSSAQRVNSKARAGFTISSKDEEDDDEWVSSESGAATPNHHDSDSETASETDVPSQLVFAHHRDNGRIARVETARQTDFTPANYQVQVEPPSARAETPTPSAHPAPQTSQQLPTAPDIHHPDVNQLQSQLRRMELDTTKETRTDPPHIPHSSPRPPSSRSKRSSRPNSTYSMSAKSELRPHPLIRGQSSGHLSQKRHAVLAPLNVVTGGAAPPQLSTSPASSIHENMTSSPTSTATGMSYTDDTSAFPHDRRASISSARSIATLPGQGLFGNSGGMLDRARTFSLLSASGSSAALSALSHLPAVTRPPSPQAVVFFPPVNPHANVDAIHSLLPGPYLSNHLTVLARRNPLRESYDRVIRAKAEASRQGQ